MNNSLSNQTLDLSESVGYGLVYQTALVTSTQIESALMARFFNLHRRSHHRSSRKKRRFKLAE